MKLAFMLKFPTWEHTYFIEKLWAMKLREDLNNRYSFDAYVNNASKCKIWISPFAYAPKIHTIRGQSDRFKIGQIVQPFVWTYKPYKSNPDPTIPSQFNFMPPLKIVSKQRFDLVMNLPNQDRPFVYIDNKRFDPDEVKQLSINDGFNSVEHFFQYFNKPVENMEIRHFTNLKY